MNEEAGEPNSISASDHLSVVIFVILPDHKLMSQTGPDHLIFALFRPSRYETLGDTNCEVVMVATWSAGTGLEMR